MAAEGHQCQERQAAGEHVYEGALSKYARSQAHQNTHRQRARRRARAKDLVEGNGAIGKAPVATARGVPRVCEEKDVDLGKTSTSVF